MPPFIAGGAAGGLQPPRATIEAELGGKQDALDMLAGQYHEFAFPGDKGGKGQV